jgi:hypothetical protein
VRVWSVLWFSSHPNDGVMTDRPTEYFEGGRSGLEPAKEHANNPSLSFNKGEREQEDGEHSLTQGRREGGEGFVVAGRKREGEREGESEHNDRESEAMFFFNVIRRLPKVFIRPPTLPCPMLYFLSFFLRCFVHSYLRYCTTIDP